MLAMYSFITFYHICVFLLEIYFPLPANKLEQIQFKASQISVILNIKKTTEQLEKNAYTETNRKAPTDFNGFLSD